MSSIEQYQKEKMDIEYKKRIIYNRAQSRINYQKQKEYKKVWEELSVKLDKI